MRIIWNGPLKEYRNKMPMNKMKTKLTERTLITPVSIHTTKTKHQNKME